MEFSEKIHSAAGMVEDARDDIKGAAKDVAKEVKGRVKEKTDPLKDGLTNIDSKYRDAKKQLREAGGVIKDTITRAKDKVAAFKVDMLAAKKNEEFLTYLHKSGKDLDLESDNWEAREAFVMFERAKSVTESLSGMYENKLPSILKGNPELKNDISEHILELANNNPEQLLRLERYVAAVAKSERQIQGKQSEIDRYIEKGGKEAMQEKLETLKMAVGFTGTFINKARLDRVGLGWDPNLAIESAKERYGLTSKAAIKREIKSLTADLKKIKGLETAQTEIRSKFSDQRAEIFLDNETAKFIHEKMRNMIDAKFAEMLGTKKLSKLKKVQSANQELRKNFEDEGRVVRTGVKKMFLKDEAKRSLDFLGASSQDMADRDGEINFDVQRRVTDKFEKLIAKTEPDRIEEEVNRYFRRKEFAGGTLKESEQMVWSIFSSIRKDLPLGDPKRIKLDLVLNRLEHRLV